MSSVLQGVLLFLVKRGFVKTEEGVWGQVLQYPSRVSKWTFVVNSVSTSKPHWSVNDHYKYCSKYVWWWILNRSLFIPSVTFVTMLTITVIVIDFNNNNNKNSYSLFYLSPCSFFLVILCSRIWCRAINPWAENNWKCYRYLLRSIVFGLQ